MLSLRSSVATAISRSRQRLHACCQLPRTTTALPLPGTRPSGLNSQRPLRDASASHCRSSAQPASSAAAPAVGPEMADTDERAGGLKVAEFAAARGTEAFSCEQDSKQLLSAAPAGAYTTMRTVGCGSIFELSFHISRLAESCRLMMQKEAGAAEVLSSHAPLLDPAALRPLVVDSVRAAILHYQCMHPQHKGELRPTVLITWQPDGTYEILSHVGPLPPRPSKPILVQIAGAPRENAAAKNSEWVRERKELEAAAPPGCNEVLLMSEGGAVVEGLSSNFFAVKDGTLYTAQEGVLLGTVRDMVLKVAQREGVPVVLQPPDLADLAQWSGACVTSTSRLMLCVDEVAVEAREERRVFGECPILSRLEKLVLEEIDSFSEPY
eukprot:jgi/Tetstr1/424564/TSEL_015090.t1